MEDDAVTDAQGRWTCSMMPSGYDPARLAIRIRHADFQPFAVYGGTVTQAIGPKGTVILRRGVAIAGRVVDREGHPIRGARVSAGATGGQTDLRTVETDADGRFRLEHLPPGETVAHRSGEGPRPALSKIDSKAGTPPVEIKLGSPRTIKGHVVDQRGNPIAGVHVAVDGWGGFSVLDWRSETGSDGRFQWDEAPRDPVWITAYKEGFIDVAEP